MPALAATDVTVTIEDKQRVARKKRHRVKLTFGDGALTYPAGGVPMPAFGKFGMYRNLDYLILTDHNDAEGIIWKYDQDNKKLRGYAQGVTVGAAGAAVLDDFPISAGVGASSARSIGLDSAAGSSTIGLGVLKELLTTDAPAAQTLFAEAVGWMWAIFAMLPIVSLSLGA